MACWSPFPFGRFVPADPLSALFAAVALTGLLFSHRGGDEFFLLLLVFFGVRVPEIFFRPAVAQVIRNITAIRSRIWTRLEAACFQFVLNIVIRFPVDILKTVNHAFRGWRINRAKAVSSRHLVWMYSDTHSFMLRRVSFSVPVRTCVTAAFKASCSLIAIAA